VLFVSILSARCFGEEVELGERICGEWDILGEAGGMVSLLLLMLLGLLGVKLLKLYIGLPELTLLVLNLGLLVGLLLVLFTMLLVLYLGLPEERAILYLGLLAEVLLLEFLEMDLEVLAISLVLGLLMIVSLKSAVALISLVLGLLPISP
jgi:hypothetical protein